MLDQRPCLMSHYMQIVLVDRYAIQRTVPRNKTHRQTSTTIQGCLQTGYESLRHRHLILGNCCPQPDHLEENHPQWDEEK